MSFLKKIYLLFFLLSVPFIAFCQLTPSIPKWVTNFGSNSGSAITSASKADAQNNIYITGPFFGTVDFDPSVGIKTLTAVGNADAFVAKYNTNGTLVWAVSFGGSGIDQGNGIALDDNGNVSVVGQFYSSSIDADPGPGIVTLNNAGNADMFLINLTTNGDLVWAKSIGTPNADFINKVAVDKSGAKIIGGQFQGTISIGNKTVSTSASFGALVAKFNNNGTVIWAFGVGNTGNNLVTGTSVDENDNVIVTGVFSGTANFNPLGLARMVTAGPLGGAFVAKYNAAGQLQWVRTIDGGILACNLALDNQGNVYAVSPHTTQLTFDTGLILPLTGSRSVCLVKYSSDGTFVWANDIGGAGAEITNYEVAARNNNIYFSGFFRGSVDFDPSAKVVLVEDHGMEDIFLVRYDSDGNYKWVINTGNNSCTENIGRTVAVDYNDDVILGGAFCSTVNFDVSGCSTLSLTAQSPTRDGFLAKYTPSPTGLANGNVNIPAVTDFCGLNDPDIIIGNLPTGGAGTYTYSWQSSIDGVSFTDIAGAASKDFDPPVIAATVFYRRVVKSGTCNLPLISNVVKLTVSQGTSISNSVVAPSITSFCLSGDPELILGVLPTGGNGTYTYQWQQSADGVNFTDIIGATLISYDPTVITTATYYRRKVTSGTCDALSNIVQIIIVPPIKNINLAQPPIVTYCGSSDPPAITGTTLTGGNGTFTYQWQQSADGANFTDISGATLISYDPIVINATTYYRRKVTSGNCDALSNVIQITIEPLLANNTLNQPAITSFCGNLDPAVITGTTPTGGNGTYAYQWQSSTDGINFSDVSGATLAVYDPPVINSIVYFRRIVSSGVCGVSTSNVIQFSTTSPLANNQVVAPAITAFCGNGDPDVFQGSVPSGGDGVYTYQWQSSVNGVSFTNIIGAVSVDYNPAVVNATTYYRRKVTSGTCELTSNVIQISIQPVLSTNTINTQLPIAFCGSGDAGLITGNVPPGGFTYTYQWQRSTDGVAFTDITGANFASYDPLVATQTIYFRRLVSSSVCVVPLISNVVVISIDQPLVNNLITSPLTSSFCNTGNPDVISGNLPTGGNGTFSFQWQASTDGVAFSDIVSATAQNFDPPVLNSTVFYRRMVTSGNCTIPLISNVVKITIDPQISNNMVNAPAVTSFCGAGQPEIITGSTASGGDGTYLYQWQTSVDNVTFADIPFETQKDYAPGILSSSVYYRRVVTSGSCSIPLVSNAVFFQVTPAIQNNTIAAPAVTTFCAAGDPLTIIGDMPTGGTGIYAYQWQNSTDGLLFSDINGATLKDIDPALLNATTYYRRTVTSGVCNIPIISNTVMFKIDVLPVVNLGTDITICIGSNTLLNPSGGSNSYNYKWSPAAGLSNPNIASPVASPVVNTTYTLTVTNGTCITTSTIFVKVIPKPVVSAGADKQILKGSSVMLNAVATGDDLQYSWSPNLYLDNPNIAQPVASPLEDITYTLTVTSPNSCFTISDDVFIKVYPKIVPPNVFSPNNDGINDLWEIPGLNSYRNFTVSVFNRNGELLYQNTGYPKGWDGTYNGKQVPTGTYYYIIDIKDAKASQSKLSGWVAVVR